MRRIFQAVLLVVLLPLGLSCENGKLQLPELPKIDFLSIPLPKLDTGSLSLIKTPLGGLQLDPTGSDAITALGVCTDLITYCFEPGARSLDQCVEAVPHCKTSKPWTEDECCPKDCVTTYSKARDKGQEPIAAFEKTFFLEADCFPGVRSLLEVK